MLNDSELDKHWSETLGDLPPTVKQLKEFSPRYYKYYTTARADLLSDTPGGLPLKYKELILLMTDVFRSNESGGRNHTRAALRAGLTKQELREAFELVALTTGILTWGTIMHHFWDEAKSFPDK